MENNNFDLADSLYLVLGHKAQLDGLYSLTSAERIAHLAMWAGGIIYNGGFRYFFEGASNIDQVAEAFHALGFLKASEACLKAKNFFPEDVIKKGYKATSEFLDKFSDEEIEEYFYPLDVCIFEIENEIPSAVKEFYIKNKNNFPHYFESKNQPPL